MAKGKIVNTTPQNFWKKRVYRVLKPAKARSVLRDPGHFHRFRGPHKPLRIATGPGSIRAEAEICQLIASGNELEAARLYDRDAQRAWASPLLRMKTWRYQLALEP